MAELIRVHQIEKHYDGVYALRRVSLLVEAGEVHALMGENGAGKSTLGKVLAGVVRPDSGQIFIDSKPVQIERPIDAQRQGVGMIFQELDLFPHLSIGENIVIRNLNARKQWLVNHSQIEQFCRPFLNRVGLQLDTSVRLWNLSIGQMQLVAIARALSMNARLLVMDEPTSALADDAVENLFRVIRELRATGVSIVYVSHKMKEIFQIADRISVMRDGAMIDTMHARETTIDRVITMMVGREISNQRQSGHVPQSQVVLRANRLRTEKLQGISFDLHRGEVLGVAGLVGAGRSELGHALFGLDGIESGELVLNGKSILPHSPRQAIRDGIGFLPEDRKLQGLMMQASVRENSSIGVLSRFQNFGFVRRRAELAAMKTVHDRTRLKTAGFDRSVSELSGGNQQKVLLAKWLLVDPLVIFLDDPTRGVDVGAKQDIYRLIDELAAAGKGVIFVSSELPELLKCCDRIMVLHEGESMGILDAKDASQEKIMSLATQTA